MICQLSGRDRQDERLIHAVLKIFRMGDATMILYVIVGIGVFSRDVSCFCRETSIRYIRKDRSMPSRASPREI